MDLTNLENIIKGLTELNAREEVTMIVDANGAELVDLERKQLAAGIDNTGQERVDAYAPMTVKIKQRASGLAAVTDHVTFFMTGELYDSLHFSMPDDNYSVVSPLPTYGKMLDRIGDQNFGLSPESRLEFAEKITLPEFAKVFEKMTTLKI